MGKRFADFMNKIEKKMCQTIELCTFKKMSERQTKAGNQEKLKKFENLKNLKFFKI